MVIVTMVTEKLKVGDCNHGDSVSKGEGDITVFSVGIITCRHMLLW